MKQLLEFIPLILFFAAYKLYGVQIASITLVIATIIQFIIVKIMYGKIEKSQWVIAISVIFFGSLTAYFNDLQFLKWKVTLIYGLFAIILLVSQYGFNKPIIKHLLAKELHLPEQVWQRLNLGWAIFFLLCLVINLYVSTYLSDNIWVDFKSFGFFGLTLIATLITGVYLYPYISQQEQKKDNNEQN
ncbi:septation protein A [Mergibacter septicus]|uniref:Inner membrane-spanning protein YciB n=1 Tax=Mergibacter septicus TaxID=221402 RepID=A0A8D4IZ85_9PAST|nr:septation protein A [Mergibacter septicus]AWX14802.1 septation protein A [Mergibacter septicus]QDJ13793.1 septation protein A [Mergibacter septicus]QDJ14053.1 septation protein A [Mergibacter septicus]UTU48499.1 septation protein A [Mergibacter septicus]WMR95873.1 septation protein A [Mergibacter septicus]